MFNLEAHVAAIIYSLSIFKLGHTGVFALNHTYLNKHKQFTRTVVITVFLMTGQRFIGGKAFHIMVYSSFLYLMGNKSRREI